MTDLDPESMRVLELARAARTPSEEDKARVGQRLAIAVGASALATAAGAASSTISAAHAEAGATVIKTAGMTKWIAGGVLLAAAVGYVALSASPRASAPHPSPRPAPAADAPAADAPATDAPATDAPAAVAAPPPSEPAPEALDAKSPPHRTAPRRHGAPAGSLAAEIELLHRAQSAWRTHDAGSALALLDEHRARYPHSQLELEREALHALTLCELGRADEGARIARAVIARAPQSPLRASLEQGCALK